MKRTLSFVLFAVSLLVLAPESRAQWITQSIDLKGGWNAVYLHVDASHIELEDLIVGESGNPIQEIWLWAPSPSTLQFIESPQQPIEGGSQWVNWQRSAGLSSQLVRLIPNAAYLVRVSEDVPTFTWNLKGKPAPPQYQWTTTGLNFIGFPTPELNPPDFDTLLSAVPELKRAAEIFHYPGGELGPGNPARVFALRTLPVKRGQAFWIRSGGVFNRYFAPVEVELPATSGVHFRQNLSQLRLLLRNIHPAPVVVTLSVIASEAPPAGQTAISGMPPLLLRGQLETATLSYGYTNLADGPQSWTLAAAGQPGSEAEVVLGVNRSAMAGNPGDLFAGILRFTDSLNLSRIDLPVSAEMGSTAGLWVGAAAVNEVQHYLKAYEKDPAGGIVINPEGQYVASSTNLSLGRTARTFPLRLIIHNKPDSTATLLQRVYFGTGLGSNLVVTTKESLLHSKHLATARRISSVHLPWTEENSPWNFTGQLRQGGSLVATIDLSHDSQSSNPFLHSYHPDHDNLDATFRQPMPAGFESYRVRREVRLNVTPPADDFASLTSGNQSLSGVYEETVTFFGRGSESRQFDVRGAFSLTRLNETATLTTE
jgi:hypothetical protein